MKRTFLAVMLVVLAVSSAFGAQGKVMLYSSMQEDQLVAIKKGFEAKYPDIVLDYYFAGTGRVITKIATEHQAGQVAADVIWVGDPSDYLSFKKEGILQKYSSPEAAAIDAKFIDPDGYYTGARMMNMGIGYNSALVTPEDAPKSWNDLLSEKWQDQVVMTDPSSAGTTKYFVAALLDTEKSTSGSSRLTAANWSQALQRHTIRLRLVRIRSGLCWTMFLTTLWLRVRR